VCRYGEYGPYKVPFACFDCQKVFKQTNLLELPKNQQPQPGESRICKCPQCGKPMSNMGHDFKAPKQNDLKQWEKVRLLYEHGFAYHSCGCGGPGFRPAELNQVQAFFEGNLPKSEGQSLLLKIQQKVRNEISKNK
jgi:NAD-dependent SIR2 family protein deacetylase